MQNYNNDVLYAGFFTRLSAYVIDSIIIGVILLFVKLPKLFIAVMNPDMILFKPFIFKFSFMDIVFYLLGLTYFVLMTYFFGATLGKKLLKIKVCKENNEKLTLIDVLYRESIGRYLSALVMFIGYIMIGVDSKKRGLHDILCDTLVIYDFEGSHKKNKINNYGGTYVENNPVLESNMNNSNVHSDNSMLSSNERSDSSILEERNENNNIYE